VDGLEPTIYKGFFWNCPIQEVLGQKPLCKIKGRQLDALETALSFHMEQEREASEFPIPGIPDRTLLLPSRALRIVYGGSMGPEIGLHSLDGEERRGGFHSYEFLNLLREIERSNKSWWKF
jgi:hypothetical protein